MSKASATSGRWTALAAMTLVVLLSLVAALQYRWTDQLGRAAEERARTAIVRSALGFAGEFDRELLRLFFQFREAPQEGAGEELARRTAAWRRSLFPELLRGLFLVHRPPGGAVTLSALDEASGTFRPAPWPEQLLPLRQALAASPSRPGQQQPWSGPMPLGTPAWLVGLLPRDVPRWPERGEWQGDPTELVLLWLDTRALRQELLPALVARYFGGSVDYRLEVRDEAGRLVWSHGHPLAAGKPDVSVPLFRLVPPERFRRRTDHRAEEPRAWPPHEGDSMRGRWQLDVTHPEGSLAAAVAHVRRRNLGVSLAVLGLLAIAIALVLVASRRAQALARQQIELVAGVSHELLTPVAALRAAGENLAAGVVTDGPQVRVYGQLVEREARRLGGLVEQVLSWAGLQAHGAPLTREPVAAAALVESVIGASAGEAARSGVSVEARVAPALPAISGDRDALERALRNLVENALRHGGSGGWVSIGAERASPRLGAAPTVVLSVEDGGPGIVEADLPHLFEPFYRGAVGASAIPGTGLGLALTRQIVEGHGGKLRVERLEPRGARFSIELPGEIDEH